MLGSRDELVKTYQNLATESIQIRIDCGELIGMELEVAREELQRRMAALPTDDDQLIEVAGERRSSGWSWSIWIAVFLLCALFVASFGAKARQVTGQWSLYALIGLEAILLSVILRVFVAISQSRSFGEFFNKLAVAFTLGIVLLGLQLCSSLVQHGWGGG